MEFKWEHINSLETYQIKPNQIKIKQNKPKEIKLYFRKPRMEKVGSKRAPFLTLYTINIQMWKASRRAVGN